MYPIASRRVVAEEVGQVGGACAVAGSHGEAAPGGGVFDHRSRVAYQLGSLSRRKAHVNLNPQTDT